MAGPENSRELKEFGYKTTVLPADKEIEKSMTDSGIDVIVSDGLTQFYSIVKNVSKQLVSHGLSGNEKFANSVQIIDKLCPYLVQDSALMETLRKRKFIAAIVDTPLVNLCMSVILYKLSIPYSLDGVLNFKKGEHWYTQECIQPPGSKTSVTRCRIFSEYKIL